MVAIDTLKVAKRLREAGFTEPQAEAVIAAVQEATTAADLATKPDIAALRSEIAAVRAELRSEIGEVRRTSQCGHRVARRYSRGRATS
jgi:hypothetical protein